MACIERRPRCGVASTPVVPEPLTKFIAAIGSIWGLIGIILGIGKAIGAVSVSGGVISVGGFAIGTAAAGGAIAGAAAAITMIVIIGLYTLDRCVEGRGLAECVAGVVNTVVDSFDSALDEILPFTAMHDRVDVVVKSRYWDVVEDGQAFVYCTDQEPPRRSEIMRCYFFDRRVCDAAHGSQIGGAVGAVGGVIAAAAIAAAIGCATIILCIIALIVAALVAAAAVLVGALAGGQIAKAASTNDAPTAAGGGTIQVGQLVTVHGNMERREHDSAANVMWWAHQAMFHGVSMSPQPFSYCEIDDELTMDGCPLPAPDVR
jgi:hypothetical protein